MASRKNRLGKRNRNPRKRQRDEQGEIMDTDPNLENQ